LADVSVVIPTYNRIEYLRNAVSSCFEGNSGVDPEVVVVDDGSDDGTRQWLQSIDDDRIRPLYQKNSGAPAARNRGLEAARGTFIRFLDDDDWLQPGALARAVRQMQKRELDVCYGPIYVTQEEAETVDPLSDFDAPMDELLVAVLREAIAFQTPRFTYRRSAIGEVRWDPRLPVRQDYDFILAVAHSDPEHGYVEGTGYYARDHEDDRISNSYDPDDLLSAQLRTVRSVWERMSSSVKKERRDALAHRVWQLAHFAGAYDLRYMEEYFSLLRKVDPTHKPPRSFRALSFLDEWIGPQSVEYILHPLRHIKNKML
jgi:glycosyltransferase involved in cell wall biosynthesis